MAPTPWRILAALLLLAAATPAAGATRRIFSYDPANEATRTSAGALTFEFNQKLMSTRLLRIRATEGPATAELKPAPPEVLGRGGLSPLIGPTAIERDLYEIEPAEDGAAMISAFCPGARRAWLAFGRLKASQNLTIHVLGADAPGRARLCRTLQFAFHGEWRLPPGPAKDPDRLPEPHFPY
jgi:hypothetical protein